MPVGAHAEHPEHGGREHLPLAPDALVVRVDDQVQDRLRVELATAPRGERRVELRGRPADERGADRLAAQRLDDAAHLPRADALQVALGECAEQRLLVALIPGEHRRLAERGAVARHLELERADAGDERARARAVAHAAALGRARVGVGPEALGELAVERGLHELLDELAAGVGVSAEGPAELARRESRLATIREAKAALEAEARAEAEQGAAAARTKLAERERQTRETGKPPGGRPPAVPDPETAVPAPAAQRNFTDPESRIMRDGTTKSFVQAYNAQAAVDSHAQVIVAASVTQAPTDVQQLVPLFERVHAHTGQWPAVGTADAGYFSAANVSAAALQAVDLYIPPDKQPHGPRATSAPAVAEAAGDEATPAALARRQMRAKLQTPEGQAHYRLRKSVVEPVFGQTKERRGFRRFALRGLAKVGAEWDLICLTHNLLKLFRAGTAVARPAPA